MALIPSLGRVRVLRHWGGIMDMSMDGSPIIDRTPVDGLYLNCGWCYGGFKATPASGWCFAHTIAKDEPHAVDAALPARPLRHRRAHRRERLGRAAQPALRPPMRIPCPYCGERGNEEFAYLGDATVQRPGPIRATPTRAPASWMDYVYLRDNPRRRASASCGSTCTAAAPGSW